MDHIVHFVLLRSKEFCVFRELDSYLSIELVKLLLQLVPFFYIQEVLSNPMLKLYQWHLVGFLRNTLIETPDHFLHLEVFIREFLLLRPAEFDQRLNKLYMLIKVLIASKFSETLINAFDVIFSNKTLDSILLILLYF